MRIRMTTQPSGTRNGAEWPIPGTKEADIELPDEEATDLITTGHAVEITGDLESHDAGREAEPWESVGVAHGEYPDATGRTGPPLTEVPEQLAVNKVPEPLIESPPADEVDGPVVPEDARTASPLDAKGPVVEEATTKATENAATRTTAKK